MDYDRGRSSVSSYSLRNWFAEFLRYESPLAKKYIALGAADFTFSTIHD